MAVLERVLPDSEITAGCWQGLSSLGRTSAVQLETFLHSQHLLGHKTMPFILKHQNQPKPGSVQIKGEKIVN